MRACKRAAGARQWRGEWAFTDDRRGLVPCTCSMAARCDGHRRLFDSGDGQPPFTWTGRERQCRERQRRESGPGRSLNIDRRPGQKLRHRRPLQPHAQLALQAAGVQPAGFAHEAHPHFGQGPGEFGARVARGTGQAQAVGHLVQVVAQGHLAVVHGVDDALARATQQGGAGNAGQVVGVDVVGDHVVGRHQGRYLLAQPLHRQAVGGVDARYAQHEGGQRRLLQAPMARSKGADTVPVGAVRACAVGVGVTSARAAGVGAVRAMVGAVRTVDAEAHLPLGVHPAAGAVGQRAQRVGLAGEGAAPVAIDAGGGQVDKARGRGVLAPAPCLGGGRGYGKQRSR